MSGSFPRPSPLFAALSALVIAGNLLLLSAFIASAVVDSDPFTLLGGLFVAPCLVFMAVQQYRGTFRGLPSAATTASVLLYGWGGLLAFAVFVTAGQAIAQPTLLLGIAPLLVPMFIAAAGSIAIGRMNALWSRRLRSATCAGAVPSVKPTFSLRELIAAISVIAALTAVTSQLIRSTPPRHAENVLAADAPLRLPQGARDVSFGRAYRGAIACEFITDEPAFRAWVDSGIGSIESDSAAISVREITEPFTIVRYFAYAAELRGPDRITVHSGLYYSWSKEDRGVYAAYDRTTGRAYYHAHSY